MRLPLTAVVAGLACALAWGVSAQGAPPPPPLEPVPEPGPPPPEVANDPELAPQITVIRRENETVEEFRVNGRLTMVKVTPLHGRPYYLIAQGTDGAFIRRDSLDTGLKIPMWLLFSF